MTLIFSRKQLDSKGIFDYYFFKLNKREMMNLLIHGKKVYLKPEDFKHFQVKISLRHGRRFSFHPVKSRGFSNLPLNKLILAFEKGLKPEQDKTELRRYLRAFKEIKDKGYKGGHQVKVHRLIKPVRKIKLFITKIKHFFSSRIRDKHLNKLNQRIEAYPDPILPDPKTFGDLCNLPNEIKKKILGYLPVADVLSFSETNQANHQFYQENEVKRLQVLLENEALLIWKNKLKDYKYRFYDEGHAEVAGRLISAYPSTVVKKLVNFIRYYFFYGSIDDQELYLVRALKACATANPEVTKKLLKKLVKTFNEEKPNYLYWEFVIFVAEFFADKDPQYALKILKMAHDKLHTPPFAVREFTFIKIYLHSDLEMCFNILKPFAAYLDDPYFIKLLKDLFDYCKKVKSDKIIPLLKEVTVYASNLHPDKGKLWHLIGQTYASLGEIEKGLELASICSKHLKIDILCQAKTVADLTRYLPQALSLAMEIDDSPLRIENLIKIAKLYIPLQSDEVISILDEALNIEKIDEKHLVDIAHILIELDPDKALQVINRIKESHFDKIQLLVKLSDKYIKLDKQFQLLEEASTLVDLLDPENPCSIVALFLIGFCYLQFDKSKGEEFLAKAFKKQQEKEMTQEETKQYSKAISCLNNSFYAHLECFMNKISYDDDYLIPYENTENTQLNKENMLLDLSDLIDENQPKPLKLSYQKDLLDFLEKRARKKVLYKGIRKANKRESLPRSLFGKGFFLGI